jgi:hypothetical protein
MTGAGEEPMQDLRTRRYSERPPAPGQPPRKPKPSPTFFKYFLLAAVIIIVLMTFLYLYE